ncbi:SLAP domain-containing protein [Lactobacillus kefiranofaciens]|uniref:SLAP domain-containing protein n=1 Tax=Lactobacillus kefiranofaciens TaxID=267818 RepID=UPI002150DA7A|nr:SLAP domain-containing protein [Lactobacillus kefiranofaciens]
MKINKKLILISAALLATTPAVGTVTEVNMPTVQAAAKQKRTITVNRYTGLYNSRGQELTHYKGKPFITFGKTTTLKYYGNPVKIKRNYYYYIGHGAYVDASYLTKINGHKVLSLNHNSYVYTRSGKRTKKLLRKGLSYAFTGKYAKNETATNYVFSRGKTAKKGKKFTVDAEVGMNVGANSSPHAYRIKGTDTYLWVTDAYSRQNVATFAASVSDLKNYTVRPPKDNLQFFNSNGENITPTGFIYPRHQLLGVDGQMYIWVPKENKAELFYHIVATSKSFDTVHKANSSYRDESIEIGNAFVKEADVETYGGLKKPELINTAAEAQADAQKQASASERNKLQALVDNEDTVKSSTAYKLSQHSTQENYDTSIKEAQTMLKSKRNLSVAEVKLTTWILQTRVKNLYGMAKRSQ